ncbi:MAG: hypothetical protein QG639_1067 [Patescibacteria group bacterium]|jgi:glycosyltransferase involved in cell wall biosynthesis|nr:hypothetical protein [Patescibacteria group bacterium]
MINYRVGIDCRLAGQSHAGIGRYTIELVKRVTAHTQIDWVLFYSHKNQINQIFPDSKIPANCTLTHTPVQHYTIQEQLQMNSFFTKASLDLLHVPHFNIPIFYARPLVITIHDLLWHEHRGSHVTTLSPWKYWIKYWFYRLVTSKAIEKAASIFVPTNTVRSTLKKYYPASYSKVVVTPEGISDQLLQSSKELKGVERNPKELLYVGSLYPHKNVEIILKALLQLPEHTLTIVSSRNVFRDKQEKHVSELGLKRRVKFLSNVSDAELARLYKSSAALVQPSLSEGFGLTGLEAIALATPVLASKIPVFKEVYKNAAIYFDPYSVDDFCRAVSELTNADTVKQLKLSSAAVLEKNNWDDLANRTYLNYQRVLHAQNQ